MALFIELLLMGVGLAMDAFAVSVCKGLGMKKLNKKQAVVIGLYFGGFQALMPLVGWILGIQFQKYITSIDHWIAFILLGFFGGKMILEAVKEWNEEDIVEVIKEEEDELVDQEWHVEKKNDTYYVTGAPIERLMSKVNIFDVESRQYMQRVLNKMGVMDKARELGLQDGEYLDIIGYQMEYND